MKMKMNKLYRLRMRVSNIKNENEYG